MAEAEVHVEDAIGAARFNGRLLRVVVWALAVIVAFMAAMAITLVVLFLKVDDVTTNTNEAVSHEIPGLKQQLADERQKNADLTFVLTQQAVPEIQNLASQVQSLGGDPGQIVLDPQAPPVTVKPAP